MANYFMSEYEKEQEESFKTTITKKVTGPNCIRAVGIGDSTMAGGVKDKLGVGASVGAKYSFPNKIIGEEQAGMQSWFTFACLLSKGRLLLVHNAGVSNDTTTGMLARFKTDVLDYNPHVVFIGDAHNDFIASTAESVTRSNIRAMVNSTIASGILPIIRLIYPENNATYASQVRRHNAWLKSYAVENNLMLVDTYAPVVDVASTTGAWNSAYSSDGTHANSAGAKVVGQAVLDQLSGFLTGDDLKWGNWVATDRVSDINILLNPLMQDDATTDGVADSWSCTGATKSLITDGLVLGKIQQVDITSGTGNILQNVTVDGVSYAVGDRIKYSGIAKAVALSGTLNFSLRLIFPGLPDIVGVISNLIGIDLDLFYFECETIIPAGATTMRVWMTTTSGTGSLFLAQQSLINMSNLDA